MLSKSIVRRTKFALMAAVLGGGTLFSSCGINDIQDNLIAGALAGVKGAATNWVDGLLIDFNEFVEAIPDNPVDTP